MRADRALRVTPAQCCATVLLCCCCHATVAAAAWPAGIPRAAACTRRSLIAAGAAATACTPSAALAKRDPFKWGPLAPLSEAEVEALDAVSRRSDAGVALPSGVRVIDLVVGDGPKPARGTRVYAHYKVWAGGFRAGSVVDYSFSDGRPYDWILGMPTERIPAGVDEGVVGMREGGWRRLVVPACYAAAGGLRKINFAPNGGRYTGLKAPYVVQPDEPAYFDLIMLDGGSGRCERFLRPPGMSEKDARKQRSVTCSARMEIY